jgi:hypothetical protein
MWRRGARGEADWGAARPAVEVSETFTEAAHRRGSHYRARPAVEVSETFTEAAHRRGSHCRTCPARSADRVRRPSGRAWVTVGGPFRFRRRLHEGRRSTVRPSFQEVLRRPAPGGTGACRNGLRRDEPRTGTRRGRSPAPGAGIVCVSLHDRPECRAEHSEDGATESCAV